ncbi:Mucin-associated surface protein (MASP) [Trypanosoma cruzi]|uniref:Mucin-associated surface protein (MASP) n=1 Tax=Trypanosoma cruzi TaxID=5693 RepID=A0A7J6XTM5_TRYCR|nr:Mucin-associated surface protein (MASP) [Trypanosoma cruzi]
MHFCACACALESLGAFFCSFVFLLFFLLLLFHFGFVFNCFFVVVKLLRGVVRFLTFIGLIFLMKCVQLLLMFFTVSCLFFCFLSVDVLLVCAEGCTQVTGVMAMMMTGRVLLVCALCVLWCGAGVAHARDRDNNAQGGCMTSGLLGRKTSYLLRGCNKAVLTPPLRSPFFIDAIQAEAKELKEISQEGDGLDSDLISQPPAPPPAPEIPPPPPPPLIDASVSDGSGRSEAGANSQTGGGISGGGGSSGISHGDKDSTVEVSALVDKSASSTANDGDGSQNTGVESATQKNNSSGTAEPSVKAPDLPALPKLQNPEVSDLDKSEISLDTKETISVEAPDRGASRGYAGESEVDTKVSSSVSSAKSKPTGKPSLPLLSTGESPTTKTTRPNDSEAQTEKNEETAASGTETDSATPKPSSKDDVAEQQNQESDRQDLMKYAATGHPAGTAAIPISTDGNGDAHGTASENGDDTGGHNKKKTHDDPESDNTNVGITASEAAPEAVNSSQTNNTATTGDSDGSTAVSHTTSPLLLLLVVACAAAAAAVVAA